MLLHDHLVHQGVLLGDGFRLVKLVGEVIDLGRGFVQPLLKIFRCLLGLLKLFAERQVLLLFVEELVARRLHFLLELMDLLVQLVNFLVELALFLELLLDERLGVEVDVVALGCCSCRLLAQAASRDDVLQALSPHFLAIFHLLTV